MLISSLRFVIITFIIMQYITNVFRTRLVIESEKLPVHDSLVGPMVEPVTL